MLSDAIKPLLIELVNLSIALILIYSNSSFFHNIFLLVDAKECIILIWSSSLGGKIAKLLNLPPLFGMVVSGIVCVNAGLVVYKENLTFVREFALATILLRAGLGLDVKTMRKFSGACIRLAFLPCLGEVVMVAILSHFILGLPFEWSFLLGFVIGAVSPAIVVPSMMDLAEQKLGTDKGIPTLIIAAASVDDVLAITGFTIALTLIRSEQSVVVHLIKGPSEAIGGVIIGILLGVILWFLPIGETKFRSFTLVALSWHFVKECYRRNFPGAAQTATLTIPFIAALRWKKDNFLEPVDSVLKIIWRIFEPLLFASIGAEIKMSLLRLSIIPALLCILFSLIFRCFVAYSVVGGDLNSREKSFVSIAWLPKATVQAALGPVALRWGQKSKDVQAIERGTLILTIAALSILITAPLGAILIKVTAPKLLSIEETNKDKKNEPKNYSVEINETEQTDQTDQN